eukprot:2568030-Amphidinium_carterae.1
MEMKEAESSQEDFIRMLKLEQDHKSRPNATPPHGKRNQTLRQPTSGFETQQHYENLHGFGEEAEQDIEPSKCKGCCWGKYGKLPHPKK